MWLKWPRWYQSILHIEIEKCVQGIFLQQGQLLTQKQVKILYNRPLSFHLIDMMQLPANSACHKIEMVRVATSNEFSISVFIVRQTSEMVLVLASYNWFHEIIYKLINLVYYFRTIDSLNNFKKSLIFLFFCCPKS